MRKCLLVRRLVGWHIHCTQILLFLFRDKLTGCQLQRTDNAKASIGRKYSRGTPQCSKALVINCLFCVYCIAVAASWWSREWYRVHFVQLEDERISVLRCDVVSTATMMGRKYNTIRGLNTD